MISFIIAILMLLSLGQGAISQEQYVMRVQQDQAANPQIYEREIGAWVLEDVGEVMSLVQTLTDHEEDEYPIQSSQTLNTIIQLTHQIQGTTERINMPQ